MGSRAHHCKGRERARWTQAPRNRVLLCAGREGLEASSGRPGSREGGCLCRPPSLSAQLVQALPSPPALTTLKLICGSSLCCPNSSHPLKGYSVAIPFRQYGEEVCEEPDGMGLHALSVTYKLCNLGQNELAFLCFVCTENNGNNTYPINCKN